MPQLDATTFPPQLIWLALTFFVLFFLMAKLALPPIAGTIAKRRGKVEGDLDRAARLRAEIDVVVQAYERALAEARAQASHTVNATRERLAHIAAERQRESIAVITERTKAAEVQIEQAKQTALSNVRSIAIDAARQATVRLIGSTPEDARISAAVDSGHAGERVVSLFHESEFWILVALVLAMVIAWRPAGRAIGGMLDARIVAIRLELQEAERLREEAEAKLADYQRKQRDAIAEAQEIVARAQVNAEQIGKQAEIELEATLKRREIQASQRIALSEAQALAEVRSAIVDVAVEATRKLLLEGLDQQRSSALIDRAIEDLPARFH